MIDVGCQKAHCDELGQDDGMRDLVETRRDGVSRRGIVAAAGIGAAASGLPNVPSALAAAAQKKSVAPAYFRFPLGDAEITIVSDGTITTGDPKKAFTGLPPDKIGELLAGSFLPTDRVVFDENILVVNTGSKLVLFDTGSGSLQAFGPNGGRLFENLQSAGISPSDVDAVVLSHAHADHICGIVIGGRVVFENAEYFINQVDHDFWLDPAKKSSPLKLFHEQAELNLLPIRPRIRFINDGEEFLPGVQAMLAPGHTPGHMVFMISSGGKSLAYIADLARHHILNLETPRVEFVGDIDPRQSVESRLRILDMLVQKDIPVVSYHFPFPGVGRIAKTAGTYRFYPAGMLHAL